MYSNITTHIAGFIKLELKQLLSNISCKFHPLHTFLDYLFLSFFFFALLCCSLKNDLCWRKWHRSVLFSSNIKVPNEKYTFLKTPGTLSYITLFSLFVRLNFQSDTSYEQQRGSISAGMEPLPRETTPVPLREKKAKDKRRRTRGWKTDSRLPQPSHLQKPVIN